jgi:hypothetical protein
MGVAVRQRERQHHHQAADEREPHHGDEHVDPEGLKILHLPDSTKRLQGEVHGAAGLEAIGGSSKCMLNR